MSSQCRVNTRNNANVKRLRDDEAQYFAVMHKKREHPLWTSVLGGREVSNESVNIKKKSSKKRYGDI